MNCLTGDVLVQTAKGPMPIKDVTRWDWVYLPNGTEQRVRRVYYTGVQDVGNLVDEHGNVLASCTADHRWWTQRGKVKASELRPTDQCGAWTGLKWTGPLWEEACYDLFVSGQPNVFCLSSGLVSSNSEPNDLAKDLTDVANYLAKKGPHVVD